MRVCTVLRSGGEFKEQHAIWLAQQIKHHNPEAEIVCLTDTNLRHPDVVTVPLRHGWPGWWSKLELFSDLLPGDVFYMDLDTVVTGPLDDLLTVRKSTLLQDFYHSNQTASGLMFIAEADKARVWAEFVRAPDFHMAQNKTRRHWGDQGFYARVLTDVNRWQKVRPGRVVSYKVHCKTAPPPAGASVVCFHGNPRPWAVKLRWIPEL